MPGPTTTGSLTDSLPTVIAEARIVREYKGVWQDTTEVRKLKEGTGLNWNEIALNQLQAQDITENTTNENAQTLSDFLLTITPQMTQILVKISDRTYRRIASVVSSKIGELAGNAMARKKDEDYLALFSTFSTGASPGTGAAFTHGHIGAAVSRIQGGVAEPSMAKIYTVIHAYQVYDIQRQITPGSGTLASGHSDKLAEENFRKGFKGECNGSLVMVDGNIAINSTPDARGATHAKDAVVAVQGMSLKHETRRDPSFGGGADEIFLTDEYAFGERASGTNPWAFAHLSDATAPTA